MLGSSRRSTCNLSRLFWIIPTLIALDVPNLKIIFKRHYSIDPGSRRNQHVAFSRNMHVILQKDLLDSSRDALHVWPILPGSIVECLLM